LGSRPGRPLPIPAVCPPQRSPLRRVAGLSGERGRARRRRAMLNGKEALRAVGEGGRWNWALVGPDPEKLPLAGCGPGSCDELRACVAQHRGEDADLYGLLRLNFGSGAAAQRRYVFLRVVGDAAGGPPSHTSKMLGAMEKALGAFASFNAKIEARDAQELSLESVISKLRSASAVDELTARAHREAVAELARGEAHAVAREVFEEQCAPAAENAARTLEAPASSERCTEQPSTSSQASRVPSVFRKGDLVVIYSRAVGQWLDDGIIFDEVKEDEEDGVHDGCKLAAGSVKVLYNNSKTFKWILPSQFKSMLRVSSRPSAPYALAGQLLKQTHNWITTWHLRHFEVSRGYLQWWATVDDANAGKSPSTSLCLAGLEMSRKGSVFYVRTNSSKGIKYSFDAAAPDSAELWCVALQEHESYCDAMTDYVLRKAKLDCISGSRSDKLTRLVGERHRSRSQMPRAAP